MNNIECHKVVDDLESYRDRIDGLLKAPAKRLTAMAALLPSSTSGMPRMTLTAIRARIDELLRFARRFRDTLWPVVASQLPRTAVHVKNDIANYDRVQTQAYFGVVRELKVTLTPANPDTDIDLESLADPMAEFNELKRARRSAKELTEICDKLATASLNGIVAQLPDDLCQQLIAANDTIESFLSKEDAELKHVLSTNWRPTLEEAKVSLFSGLGAPGFIASLYPCECMELLDLLMALPNITSQPTRTSLLFALPHSLVVQVDRASEPLSDVAMILTATERWGQITSGLWATDVVLRNAIRTARGSTVGAALVSFRDKIAARSWVSQPVAVPI